MAHAHSLVSIYSLINAITDEGFILRDPIVPWKSGSPVEVMLKWLRHATLNLSHLTMETIQS